MCIMLENRCTNKEKSFFWREIDIWYLGTKHHRGKNLSFGLMKISIYRFYFKLYVAGVGIRGLPHV